MCVILQYTSEIDQMNDSLNISVAQYQVLGNGKLRSSYVNVDI